MKPKITIDFLMTVLLLLLMAYQITGQELHEWFGVGMLVLFLLHNILNIRWYGNLLKGRYTLLRVMQTMINLGVLVSILCLGFSGIVMSRHVFAALPINGPMATARMMHLAASYWGFVLMSVHLGMHWSVIFSIFCKMRKEKTASNPLAWLIRVPPIMIAGYGLYLFIQKNIISYLFLRIQFVFFDFEQSAVSVLAEYIVMMGFWISFGFYVMKGIRKISLLQTKRKEMYHEEN